jgi:two-component system chemotaxis sensor kinase CheA
VEDDGFGLDTEAIRKKALQKGLVSEDSELMESEINNLIFSPGFSTAGVVTSVSGRGVGLDVVKRSIEGMRGTVEVESHPGQGTVFTIRLPLTLAIIEGLLLLVGTEKYIVPLSLVEECVFLTRADEAAGHGRNITRLRGEIVPYVKMREWFDIEGQPLEIQQVVIVQEEGRRLGILVDHVIGEHQTVIKTLGKVYRDVDGVSGATILGDGTVSLILDVSRIMRVTEEMESKVYKSAI